MVTLEEALTQRRAFNVAVPTNVVPQVRVEMLQMWREWRDATDLLVELESDAYAIALYCEVVPETLVYDIKMGDCRVIRKLTNGGQCSLHMMPTNPDRYMSPQGVYVNCRGDTSPVVVRPVPMHDRTPEPVGPSIPGEDGQPISTPDLIQQDMGARAADEGQY